MILRMFQQIGRTGVLIFILSSVVHAQPTAPVVINSDLRLFAMMTALNAAGFDVEVGQQYHPVRAVARSLAKQLDPDLISRLQEFYKDHKNGQPDDAQLSKYISLALNLLLLRISKSWSGRISFLPMRAK